MGNRRMGARRLNALLGQKLAEDNTNKAGDGSKSFVVSNIVSRRGTEVVTEITVDLGSSEGAASMSGDAGEIIGFSSSAEGVQAGGHAYLARLTPAVNGYIYGAEMICTERPAPAAARDIDLKAGTTAARQFSGSVHGSVKTLVEPEGDWALGGYQATGSFKALEPLLDTDLDDHYLFLTKGSSTDSLIHEYTAGKYTIRLLGVLATEDK